MTTMATITTKNQLTIPKEIVEALNLEGLKKVLVSIRGETLVVKPLTSKVESLAGSLSFLSPRKPVDFRKVREKTREKIAAEIAREGT